MPLPIDLPGLLRAGDQLNKDRDIEVRILFVIEPDAPDELLDAVQASFRALTSAATIDVKLTSEVVEGAEVVIPDMAVVLMGSGTWSHESIETLRRIAVPVCGLALTADKTPIALASGLAEENVFAGVDLDDVMKNQLGTWIVERVPKARLALANNFPVVRKAVAEHATRMTAWQNAVIGFVAIFPGADLPLMTANQAKMVLQIAAAYGEPLGPERVKELGAVVAGGFVFRGIARQALVLLPGFGWALKAAIAYTGTVAMGRAATEYFEDGADIYTVIARLQLRAEEIGEQAASMVKRGELPEGLAGAGEEGHPARPLGRLAGLIRSKRASYTVASDAERPITPEATADPSGAAG